MEFAIDVEVSSVAFVSGGAILDVGPDVLETLRLVTVLL